MKKSRVVVFIVIAMAVAALLIAGVYNLSRGLLTPNKSTNLVDCSNISDGTMEYVITIQNGQLSINNIKAKPCDSLTIVNADNQLRLMAFGVHDKHETYSGVTEETLRPGEQMSVTLEQTGTYTFHDHLHDEVKGTFTVE